MVDFFYFFYTLILILDQSQPLPFCILSSQNEVLQNLRQNTHHSFDQIDLFHLGLHIMQGLDCIVRFNGLNQRLAKQFEKPLQKDKRVIKPKIADYIEYGAIEQILLQSLRQHLYQTDRDEPRIDCIHILVDEEEAYGQKNECGQVEKAKTGC